MTINGIMASHGITPDTDITVLENSVLLFQAWQSFTNTRTNHWLATKEWLPSYFEKEAEKFFGGRYSEDEVHECWLRADEHLNPNWEEEANREYEALSDEEKAEMIELQDDLFSFISERMGQREREDAILAELAKEFE